MNEFTESERMNEALSADLKPKNSHDIFCNSLTLSHDR